MKPKNDYLSHVEKTFWLLFGRKILFPLGVALFEQNLKDNSSIFHFPLLIVNALVIRELKTKIIWIVIKWIECISHILKTYESMKDHVVADVFFILFIKPLVSIDRPNKNNETVKHKLYRSKLAICCFHLGASSWNCEIRQIPILFNSQSSFWTPRRGLSLAMAASCLPPFCGFLWHSGTAKIHPHHQR